MPVIRPKQQAVLEDDEPYEGTLSGWEWGTGSAEYGSKPQLQVEWDLGNDETIMDYISPALGTQRNGTPSRLAQLCNAVAGKPATTKVAWFDTDSLEFGYEEGQIDGKLRTGIKVIFRGGTAVRKDGTGERYKIAKYQMVRTQNAAGRRREPAPVTDETDVRTPRPASSDLAPNLDAGDSPAPARRRAQPVGGMQDVDPRSQPVGGVRDVDPDSIPF